MDPLEKIKESIDVWGGIGIIDESVDVMYAGTRWFDLLLNLTLSVEDVVVVDV